MIAISRDFPDLNVWVESSNVVELAILESVQFARRPHHAFDQFAHLHVRLHFIEVQIVLFLTHFLGIVTVVPRFDRDPGVFTISNRLHVGDLLFDAGDCFWPDFHHQFHRHFRLLGHSWFKLTVSVSFVAQQLRPFRTQLQDRRNNLVVVVFISVVTPVVVVAPDLFAQLAVVRICQERIH